MFVCDLAEKSRGERSVKNPENYEQGSSFPCHLDVNCLCEDPGQLYYLYVHLLRTHNSSILLFTVSSFE